MQALGRFFSRAAAKMGQYIQNPPEAGALMEAARSFGNYDIASAIADLVDNSITAAAKTVEVTCLWNDGDPEISIADDGAGMDRATLHQAMKPASKSPTEVRGPEDLGRFGLGLKTASLSQCRCLTVITRQGSVTSGARWDLDHIDGWSMEVLDIGEIEQLIGDARLSSNGTIVIWTKLDRLTEGGSLSADAFNELIDYARSSLALTFHRFIDPPPGSRKLKLVVNGFELQPFDPFHEKHPATQPLERETVTLRGDEKIVIAPFILPHFSKLSADEYESLAGEEGYLKNQGFYVYRNRRLILHGTWFRLIRHGDLAKLARVQIDIPNSVDDEWKITVDKAGVQIPSALRERLRALIERIKEVSGRVYRGRGARLDADRGYPVWRREVRQGVIRYRIDDDHPVLSQLKKALTPDGKRSFGEVLRLIEQNFPLETLYVDISDSPNSVIQTPTDPDDIRSMLRTFIERFLDNGGEKDVLTVLLKETEPFRSNPRLVQEELKRAGAGRD